VLEHIDPQGRGETNVPSAFVYFGGKSVDGFALLFRDLAECIPEYVLERYGRSVPP